MWKNNWLSISGAEMCNNGHLTFFVKYILLYFSGCECDVMDSNLFWLRIHAWWVSPLHWMMCSCSCVVVCMIGGFNEMFHFSILLCFFCYFPPPYLILLLLCMYRASSSIIVFRLCCQVDHFSLAECSKIINFVSQKKYLPL